MKRILVICDSEKKYAERLADYLSHKKEWNHEIWIFTSIEAMNEALEGMSIEILLIEEKLYYFWSNEENQVFYADKTMILSESKEKMDCVAEDSVYKYQPASGILGKLLSECLDYGLDGYGKGLCQESEIIGIYSPVKRTLKTTFSYTLAQIMAEENSVLYLNLEGCSGISNMLPVDPSTNLADLLYDYSVYREEYPKRFHQFIQISDGLGIVPPVETVSEIQCILVDDWISMLRRLRRNETYKKIVVDVGDNVNGIIDILRMCDVIYMPYRDDCISNAKMDSFEAGIKKYDSSDNLSEKIHKITFPHFDDLGEGLLNLKYSQLGGYVRQLVKGS